MSTQQEDSGIPAKIEERLAAIEARQDAFSRKLGLGSDQDGLNQRLDVLEARQDALSKKLGFLAECITGAETIAMYDDRGDPCIVVRLDNLEKEFSALGRRVSRLNKAVTERPGQEDGASDQDVESS